MWESPAVQEAERGWLLHESHKSVRLDSPAAGAALTVTVPGAVQWKVLSVSFTYTASANAATRTPLVRFLDQSGVAFHEAGSPFTLIATNVSRVSFGVLTAQFGANSSARMGASIPPMWLEDGLRISLTADLIDVADTVTNARLFVHQRPVQPLG